MDSVPDTVAGGSVTLFQSAQLAQLTTILRTLQTLSIALPILAVLVLAGAVGCRARPPAGPAVARRHRDRRDARPRRGPRTAARRLRLVAARRASSPGAAATSFFDTLVRFLRNAIRTVAAVGLVLLVGAALAGPSPAAVRLRGAVGGGMSALGLDLGRPALWTDRHRRALDIAIVVIAAVVLFATNAPTPGLVLGLAIAVLVGMLLVELLAHAHGGPPPYRGQPSM